MLKRYHSYPSICTSWYHEVQIDAFHADMADWRPQFAVLKRWHLDLSTRSVVWSAASIKVYGIELEQADFLIFEQGFSEAQREAKRLDAEYPPGEPVVEQEQTS